MHYFEYLVTLHVIDKRVYDFFQSNSITIRFGCVDYEGNLSVWLDKRQAVIDIYVDFCNNSSGRLLDDINKALNRSIIPIIT